MYLKQRIRMRISYIHNPCRLHLYSGKRVNFTVENTRVGQITDYDKLTLEIWTNGTIQTDEAISLSAKILIEHFKLFMTLTDHANDVEIMVEKKKTRRKRFLR